MPTAFEATQLESKRVMYKPRNRVIQNSPAIFYFRILSLNTKMGKKEKQNEDNTRTYTAGGPLVNANFLPVTKTQGRGG